MKPTKTIVLTGGGSGGHLTPVLAVAAALRIEAPGYKLVYIGQKGDSLGDIMHDNPVFDEVYTVRAGKFRRYHGEGLLQIFNIKTMLLNIRDGTFVMAGFFQSLRLLRKIKPSVVFCKGGFVGVPVCVAAIVYKIPYVTHDSDALPGLANRLLGPWARIHAVGLPKELYRYAQDKTVTVGVPIHKQYRRVTEKMQQNARAVLALPQNAKVLLVIGGGLGAQRVNVAVIDAAKKLFKDNPNLYILHVAGRGDESVTQIAYEKKLTDTELKRVRVYGFTNEVARLSEAATLVLTRAGATNMAEFAVQGKPCIIVPNPLLTGGHQLKNAAAYQAAQAAVIVTEQDLKTLASTITQLISDKAKQQQLSDRLSIMANSGAAESLAHILVTIANKEMVSV